MFTGVFTRRLEARLVAFARRHGGRRWSRRIVGFLLFLRALLLFLLVLLALLVLPALGVR